MAHILRILLAFALIAGLSPAVAQQFNTIPDNTFIGRLGTGTGSGPAQAVPFGSLPWTIGSTPINGGVSGQFLYDNNGKVGEYSASAARTYLGMASVYSVACSSNQWISAIVAGVPGCTQPAFSSLSGNIAVSQMNSGTSASASTMWRGDGTWVAPQTMPYTPTNASPSVQTIQAQLQKIPVSCEDYSGGCTTANIQQAMTDAVANGRCFQFNSTYVTTATVSLVAVNSNPCFVGKGGLRGPASGTLTAVLEIKNFTGMTVDGNISLDCNANAYIGAGLKVWSSGASVQYHDIAFSEYANCRQAIQIGDPSQSTLPISEITISRGFMFNVAQGVRVWSSQAVVNVKGMHNIVDPHSSGNWALSATGTCSGAQITLSGVGANSYFDQYDAITGTGISASTYIIGQVSGTGGGAGVYNLSQSCTSTANAITGEKRGINYWATGGNISVSGGETLNTVVSNGFLCVIDIMASPNQYGYCSFNGGIIENAGALAASFNPTAIGSPIGGAISFTGGIQGSSSNTTLDAISTDASFPGVITVANSRFTAGSSRTNKNIVAANSATKIYFDLVSFGTNNLQGYAGVTGGTQFMSSKDLAQGVAVTTSSSQAAGDSIITFGGAGTITYTLLSASTYPGRMLYLNNTAAQAVNSASSNILNQSGSSGSAIFPATAGKWMILVSDQSLGNFWRIVANN